MASSRELSYWACVFSVLHLLRGPERRELFDSDKSPKSAYLWTWTFADPHPRADVTEAARRWEKLRMSLQRDGRKFVRSLEQGEQGSWHYHGVTGDRWDAAEMWERAARFGFGRVDVKEIPLEKALYVAKYIRKKVDIPRGMRRWACVGFDGVPVTRLKVREKVLQICKDEGRSVLRGAIVWYQPETRHAWCMSLRPEPLDLHITQMELNASTQKYIIGRLQLGSKIAVGEYRGTVVRKVSVDDWKTKQTSTKIVAEHTVEIGGSAVKVGQWLPSGAVETDVKPPAQKGQLVIIEINTDSKKYGIDAASITPVDTLPLK